MKNELTCCGKPVATRFCPHCGSEVNTTPIRQLLMHIRMRAQAEESALKSGEADLADGLKGERYIAGRKVSVAKWRGWAEALEKLIDSQEGAG